MLFKSEPHCDLFDQSCYLLSMGFEIAKHPIKQWVIHIQSTKLVQSGAKVAMKAEQIVPGWVVRYGQEYFHDDPSIVSFG